MPSVITSYPRPGLSLVQAFEDQASATVHEAAGRIGAVDPAIKPLAPGVRLLGTAVTVSCHPRDNLMLHKALQIAQPGDVLVADTGGYHNAGYWGGLMATSALARGLSGLAIDGGVRDSAEMIEMGFTVFSRCKCIRGTTKTILGDINHPMWFGGVLVHPGDLILGDDDGLVVVPQKDLQKVLAAAQKRVEKEIDKAAKLKQGITSVELNKLDAVFESLGLIEE
jgi:4-hydroxy-4-methyl-2-oxoglutarate aldolase